MKSVLRKANPYVIWQILTGKKTVEVGKDFPKATDWNKTVEMYCSKDMKSFNRIPTQDQEWMRKYLGKVTCKFVCDYITKARADTFKQAYMHNNPEETGMSDIELYEYAEMRPIYFLHISKLKIYDTSKALSEFYKVGKHDACVNGKRTCFNTFRDFCRRCDFEIRRPPQSGQYVEVQK